MEVKTLEYSEELYIKKTKCLEGESFPCKYVFVNAKMMNKFEQKRSTTSLVQSVVTCSSVTKDLVSQRT